MIELVMIAAACIAMYRIAENDEQSPWAWVAITFGICMLCLAIPLPLIRVGIAAVIAFGGMIAYKVVTNR